MCDCVRQHTCCPSLQIYMSSPSGMASAFPPFPMPFPLPPMPFPLPFPPPFLGPPFPVPFPLPPGFLPAPGIPPVTGLPPVFGGGGTPPGPPIVLPGLPPAHGIPPVTGLPPIFSGGGTPPGPPVVAPGVQPPTGIPSVLWHTPPQAISQVDWIAGLLATSQSVLQHATETAKLERDNLQAAVGQAGNAVTKEMTDSLNKASEKLKGLEQASQGLRATIGAVQVHQLRR